MEWFKFNNYDSRDFDIIVKEMPAIITPSKDIESIKVTGSDRQLHIDKGSYSAYPITIAVIFKDTSKIDEIKQKFKGSGKLILSTLQNRYYDAIFMNQVSFSKYLSVLREAPFQFEVNPIAHSIVKKELNISSNQSIIVGGTAHTYPTIKVTGTGSFAINHVTMVVNETGVVIDCNNMTITNNGVNKADKVDLEGMDFPVLNPGENLITLEGITNLEISYEEGWL